MPSPGGGAAEPAAERCPLWLEQKAKLVNLDSFVVPSPSCVQLLVTPMDFSTLGCLLFYSYVLLLSRFSHIRLCATP